MLSRALRGTILQETCRTAGLHRQIPSISAIAQRFYASEKKVFQRTKPHCNVGTIGMQILVENSSCFPNSAILIPPRPPG